MRYTNRLLLYYSHIIFKNPWCVCVCVRSCVRARVCSGVLQVDMRHSWNTGGEEAEIPNGMDLSSYYVSVEWDLMKVWAKKTNSYYPCCREPYPDVTFHFIVSAVADRLWRRNEFEAPEKFFVVSLHFSGCTSTISLFGERFRGGQYSLVSFLVVICESGGSAPTVPLLVSAPVPYIVGVAAYRCSVVKFHYCFWPEIVNEIF